MTTTVSSSGASLPAAAWSGPPRWMVLATGGVAGLSFVMAIAETSWWMHYLIDDGEYVSLVGLVLVTVAGAILYRARRLLVSLPLAVPWLLFPVITQGDQLIDNLSINWMRLITHVLLAALFATPVAVIVLATVLAVGRGTRAPRRWTSLVPGLQPMREGRLREGASVLAAALLVAEIWVAAKALGLLMIVTLVIMALGTLIFGTAGSPRPPAAVASRPGGLSERFALGVLLTGVIVSLGLFVVFKYRPGAYQGSPSYFMDPAQQEAGFRLDRLPVGGRAPALPSNPDQVRAALVGYAAVLDRLVTGYYLLDRNYTYDFHNHLFLRRTAVLPNYRAVAFGYIREAEALQAAAQQRGLQARSTLEADDPLAALLDDVHAYVAFNLARIPMLEKMSAEFQRTPAGLQHAAHLFEGEGKVVTGRLSELLDKHQGVLQSPVVAPITKEFGGLGRAMVDRYSNRIVGF